MNDGLRHRFLGSGIDLNFLSSLTRLIFDRAVYSLLRISLMYKCIPDTMMVVPSYFLCGLSIRWHLMIARVGIESLLTFLRDQHCILEIVIVHLIGLWRETHGHGLLL